MKTLQALHKKFYRDYLPFFQELSQLYKSGKNKKEITETVNLVKKVQILLSDITKEGQIGIKDADNLYGLVEEIEQRKQYFLEEMQQVKAFQERIQKVEAKTGISVEDLNVTKDIVKEGVRQTRKKLETTQSVLKRAMPETYGLGSKAIQALGISTLGPFYGLAKAGYGVGKDVLSIKRGFSERKEKKLESSLRADLRTSGSRVPSTGMEVESLKSARKRPPEVTDFAGISKRKPTIEQQTAPLKEFFDKGAYKAKWTKELLDSTKTGKKKDLNFIEALSSKFMLLGAGILPLLGKGGLIAGLGAACVFAGYEINKLKGVVKDYLEVQKNVAREIKKQIGLQKKFTDRLDISLGEKLRRSVEENDESSRLESINQIKTVQQERAAKQAKEIGLFETWKSGLSSFGKRITGDKTKPGKIEKHIPENLKSGEVGKSVVENSRTTGNSPLEINLPSLPGIDVLNETIKKLNEQLQKSQTQNIPGSRKGNIFDSADVLINSHASGRMTLGD